MGGGIGVGIVMVGVKVEVIADLVVDAFVIDVVQAFMKTMVETVMVMGGIYIQ